MNRKKISTTLYIRSEILNKILKKAENKKIHTDHIISILLRKAVENKQKIKNFSPVKYQKKNNNADSKIYHVKFDIKEYEIFTDYRNICKVSVSLLLAIAVKEFLDETVDCSFNSDNYLNFNYTVSKKCKNNFIIWKLYWDKTIFHRKK